MTGVYQGEHVFVREQVQGTGKVGTGLMSGTQALGSTMMNQCRALQTFLA
jgi:hypothetical protein